MASFLPPTRSTVDVEEPGESFESVPWESLRFEPKGVDRRVWFVIAAVVGVAGLVAVIGRSPRETSIPPAVDSTTVTTVAASTSTTSPAIVTEADLKALDPTRIESQAMAFAEVAIAEYFSAEAGGVWQGVVFTQVRPTFVERVVAISATEVGPFQYRVLVAASVLDADESGTFERRPLRAVTIELDLSDGAVVIRDLPTPAELPPFRYEPLVGGETRPAPDALGVDGTAWGTVDREATSMIVRSDSVVRLHTIVTDEAGNRWPVSADPAAGGAPVPAG